jgi:hypothetical protein
VLQLYRLLSEKGPTAVKDLEWRLPQLLADVRARAQRFSLGGWAHSHPHLVSFEGGAVGRPGRLCANPAFKDFLLHGGPWPGDAAAASSPRSGQAPAKRSRRSSGGAPAAEGRVSAAADNAAAPGVAETPAPAAASRGAGQPAGDVAGQPTVSTERSVAGPASVVGAERAAAPAPAMDREGPAQAGRNQPGPVEEGSAAAGPTAALGGGTAKAAAEGQIKDETQGGAAEVEPSALQALPATADAEAARQPEETAARSASVGSLISSLSSEAAEEAAGQGMPRSREAAAAGQALALGRPGAEGAPAAAPAGSSEAGGSAADTGVGARARPPSPSLRATEAGAALVAPAPALELVPGLRPLRVAPAAEARPGTLSGSELSSPRTPLIGALGEGGSRSGAHASAGPDAEVGEDSEGLYCEGEGDVGEDDDEDGEVEVTAEDAKLLEAFRAAPLAASCSAASPSSAHGHAPAASPTVQYLCKLCRLLGRHPLLLQVRAGVFCLCGAVRVWHT